jgi:hypothetical protein
MKKEILLAIIGGCLLGLVIGFGLWRLNIAFSSSRNQNKESDNGQQTKNSDGFSIELTKISDNDVFYENPVIFSGITKPNSKIIISSEDSDYFSLADNKGSFEKEIKLIGGINQIIITAFDLGGEKKEKKLLVIYSSEFAKYIDGSPEEQVEDATSSTRGKIMQKVTEASYSPKAYLGTVTDITDATMQIKTQEGSIEQLSTSEEEISVLKMGKTNKEVALADVAIGDFIVAMGFKNGNSVLNTKRILVTTPPTSPIRETDILKITQVNKKDFEGEKLNSSDTFKVTPITSTDIYLVSEEEAKKSKFSNLEVDNLVLVTGKFSSSPFNPQSIFILEEK